MRFCAAFRDLIGPLSQTIKMTLSYRGAYITCHRSSVSITRTVFKTFAAHLRTDVPPCFAFGIFFFTRMTHFLTSDVSQMKIFWLGLVIGNIYLVYR